MQILVKTDRHIEGSAKLTQEVETTVQQALGRFGDRITRVEVYLSDENSSKKFGDTDKRCVIEARLGGLQPITVSHQGSSLDQALGGAADKLEKTLKRTLGRKGSIFKRTVRERAELSDVYPVLQRDAETGEQDDFINVLRPLLGYLGNHARRELRIMEANGTLYPGQVIFADLLDEVVTRAWLQFADRPQWMALDLWLTKILDEILEEQIHVDQRIGESLHQQTGRMLAQNVPQVDEQEWWVWLLGEDESVTEVNEVPDRHSTWAEQFLEAEELVYGIHSLLGGLPRRQRQAFILNVLEAYDLPAIAMLQGRPEGDVQSDVESARSQLRQQLRAGARPQTADQGAEVLAGSSRTPK
jgi:DNA-directed RNA polymerase specialized sigma24 family protein/ribosome-associated translation inhibitor RaiA